MAADEDTKERLRHQTRGTAEAFVEDLGYLKEILSKTTTNRGDIRRMSGVIRKLLVDKDGDLRKIAPPRIGRYTFRVPVSSTGGRGPNHRFYGKGGGIVHSMQLSDLGFISGEYLWNNNTGRFGASEKLEAMARPLENYLRSTDSEKADDLSHDQFLAQEVLFWKGESLRRGDVLRYVANVAEGVHSGAPENSKEQTLQDISYRVFYNIKSGQPVTINVNMDKAVARKTFDFDMNKVNGVLFELLSTAFLLITAPSMEALRQSIVSEIEAKAEIND